MFVCCDPGAEETDVDEAIISKSNKYMFRNSEEGDTENYTSVRCQTVSPNTTEHELCFIRLYF